MSMERFWSIRALAGASLLLGLLVPAAAAAAPSVTSVAGALWHGSEVSIEGSGFGQKPQAAPFVWDDCTGADPHDAWDFVYPFANDPAFRLTYRTPQQITKASGAGGGVALPHGHITRYLAGAHYNSGGLDAHSGLDVCAGKNGQQDYQYTYISYYARVDPDWYAVSPESTNDHNFKEYDYAAGSGYMGDGRNLTDPLIPTFMGWAEL